MIKHVTLMSVLILILGMLPGSKWALAKTVEYDLVIAQKEINITAKPTWAMTINGGIPGPTLHFTEGDEARIRVHNKMNVETSIHWHGILLPPDMDGVPYVSFPPIAPGTTFTYEFPIRQSGTYWYHSHTGLQEQRGVYGAIVIEPRQKKITVDHDYVVVLSDWTNEDPHEVNRTLKRGSDWYAIEKGAAQSILGAARLGMLGDYIKRELQRMPPMDLSDIAYDRFLANGNPQISFPAKPGETVRLRIVDGSATTYFYLEFAGGPMSIVSADGQDVQPVREKRFLIAVAETYDVLIHVPGPGSYELRATAHDGSALASVWIGSGPHHPAPDIPKPNLYHTMGKLSLKRIFSLTPEGSMGMSDQQVRQGRFDQPKTMAMGSMASGSMSAMSRKGKASMSSSMTVPSPSERNGKRYGLDFRPLAADVSSSSNLAVDGMDPRRPWPPYTELRATKSTSLSKTKPVRIIRLTLDGDMDRYVWFLNNRALSESDSIRIRKGEIVRFIMINRTMMHHPMHLHGHFFRVINGQGDYSPLKHTVDVAPMSTTVIEFNAEEVGDWFFHCHLLYHLKSGMARVVHYENFALSPQLARLRPNLYKESWYPWGQVDIFSNMTEGFVTAASTRNILSAEWEVGWEKVDSTEWEGILSYDRYINRFLTLFTGTDLLGAGSDLETSRAIFGLRYLLPLNLESSAWVDTSGGARFNLAKSFEITPRCSFLGEVQYDTHDLWESRFALKYIVQKNLSIVGQWHSDYGFGGGLRILF